METHHGDAPAFQRGVDGLAVPRYAQIAQMIRQEILSGKFQIGQRLAPSEAALAADLGVTTGVVRQALRLLRDEGWIMTQHGIGSVVARDARREVVPLHPGEETDSRMPTPAERRVLGMAEGVPVTVVRHADGTETPYDSTRYRVAWAEG